MANKPDIVELEGCFGLRIKIKKKETQKIPRAERGAREDVESKGNGDASGDPSTLRCNRQAGRVAPADPTNNF